ncbi:MAG: SEL1-like repeat protein [bacterium]|nr:SEL1-like repeat protein [bacterium]
MRRISNLATVAACVLLLVPGVILGDYYAGLDAYERGDFSAALENWLPLARQGDAEAQFRAARVFAIEGELQDLGEAFGWYLAAAESGHARAQNNLGGMYEAGRGTDPDPGQAARWYRAAAERGRPVAQNNLARLYEEGLGVERDTELAARWYRAAAEANHPSAQNRLGLLYAAGDGVRADDATAARWFRRAARRGVAEAENNLAVMLDRGTGLKTDGDKALKWYLKAADHGLVAAQRNLGSLYRSRDQIDVAREWLTLAASGTAEAAALLRDEFATSGTPADLPLSVADARADDVAENAAPRALEEVEPGPAAQAAAAPAARAAGDDAEDQYRLARMYATGQGRPLDRERAEQAYLRAAQQGHGMAAYKLGFLYLRGLGGSKKKDYVRAYHWFDVAAELRTGDAAEWRDKLLPRLTPTEIEQAEALAAAP